MGAVGSLIGSGLLGIGAEALNRRGTSSGASADAPAVVNPPPPPAPAVPGDAMNADAAANALAEAERERAKQRALIRRSRAPEIFTSGLGAAGLADTSRKTLLGG